MEQTTLTHAQQRLALETIAGRMNTLHGLLMLLQSNELDDWATGTILDAAQSMAEAVGAMADDAAGGSVVGDVRRWLYGPLFAGATSPGRA